MVLSSPAPGCGPPFEPPSPVLVVLSHCLCNTDRVAVTFTGALWPLSSPGGCNWPLRCAGVALPRGEAEPWRLRRSRRPSRSCTSCAHLPPSSLCSGLVFCIGVALGHVHLTSCCSVVGTLTRITALP